MWVKETSLNKVRKKSQRHKLGVDNLISQQNSANTMKNNKINIIEEKERKKCIKKHLHGHESMSVIKAK